MGKAEDNFQRGNLEQPTSLEISFTHASSKIPTNMLPILPVDPAAAKLDAMSMGQFQPRCQTLASPTSPRPASRWSRLLLNIIIADSSAHLLFIRSFKIVVHAQSLGSWTPQLSDRIRLPHQKRKPVLLHGPRHSLLPISKASVRVVASSKSGLQRQCTLDRLKLKICYLVEPTSLSHTSKQLLQPTGTPEPF